MDKIILTEKNGKILANSREVAERFGKSHGSVLKSIQGENRKGYHINGLVDELASKGVNVYDYFIYSTFENRGKLYPEYLMTRDGFSLLVMGFTGKEVLDWKLKYIEAFNTMENKFYNEKILYDNQEIYLDKSKSIYVLLADDNSVKIGVSNNIKHRINTLENQTGKRIINYYITKPCSNSYEIEKMAHIHFKNNRIYGEWFNIDFNEAYEYVKNLYKNMATYIWGNKLEDVKKIEDTFEKVHLTHAKINIPINNIKEMLSNYVDKGLLNNVPETYEEALNMICEQNILYYTRLKESLSCN